MEGTRTFNFQPHPFCITEKHVSIAADRFSGMLTEEVLDMAPCGIGRRGSPIKGAEPCHLKRSEHTHETAIVVVVPDGTTDLNLVPGLHEWLLAAKPLLEANKIDGFMFPSEAQVAKSKNAA